jgi:hypothetical protein
MPDTEVVTYGKPFFRGMSPLITIIGFLLSQMLCRGTSPSITKPRFSKKSYNDSLLTLLAFIVMVYKYLS